MTYEFMDTTQRNEVMAREGYYRDWSHIDANVFHQIMELVTFIREKGHGIDTREAISQAFERIYHDMAIEGNANMEVSAARGSFETLVLRLANMDGRISNTMSQAEFDSWVATLLDGGPSIFMDSLAVLQSTYPNGASGVALVRETDPARIYVWDGSDWKDFGEYQGLEPKDDSISTLKLVNGATTRVKLDIHYSNNGVITSGNLDNLHADGTTTIAKVEGAEILNGPNIKGSYTITVLHGAGGWVTQIASSISRNQLMTRRFRITESGISLKDPWVPLNYMNHYPYLTTENSLNDFVEEGKTIAVSPKDGPENLPGENTWLVDVKHYRTEKDATQFWGVQTLTRWSSLSSPLQFKRTIRYTPSNGYAFSPYVNLTSTKSYFQNNGEQSSGDLNQFSSGVTLVVRDGSGTFYNLPINLSGTVTTYIGVGGWTQQYFAAIGSSELYWRQFRSHNGTISNEIDWVNISTNSSNHTGDLYGKNVVNLGDSIFGNTRGTNSVSNRIAERTGATVHNIGFGGSRVAQHASNWDPFSFYRLADEIVKDNSDPTKWALQDAIIVKLKAGEISGMPSYFEQHLNDLKAIDWTSTEYLTVAGGTNDYTAQVPTDNVNNRLDTATYAGALRYGLEKIMTKYPHLNVLICTPMYRFWWENGEILEDSDSREYAGQVLPDFVEAAKIVGKEFKTPVLDNYFELGINQYNRELYFDGVDGTHPNPTGNIKLGNKIGSVLINSF